MPFGPNPAESAFAELAVRNGWRPTKRGWPDFLCFNDATGEAIAVEVKPRTRRGSLKALKRDQVACLEFLQRHGIRCFVSDGATLEPFSADKHRRRSLRLTPRSRRRTIPSPDVDRRPTAP